MKVVMTRHLMQRMEEFSDFSDPNPSSSNPHVPLGIDLERPFPTAKFFFIDHGQRDGWAYVYWVDYRLLQPQLELGDYEAGTGPGFDSPTRYYPGNDDD